MPRNSALNLVTATEGGRLIVAATGSLDIATVDQLEGAVGEQLADGHAVVVDLSGLSVCDSTGLGAMVRLYRRARSAGQPFVLRNPRQHVAEVLAMTGIDKIIPIEPMTR